MHYQAVYKRSARGKVVQQKYYRSDSKRASSARWREKNRGKIFAHRRVVVALRRGDLVREPCVVCGDPNSMAHHEDYSKPLVVQWLCNFHHSELHRKRKEGNPMADETNEKTEETKEETKDETKSE